MDLPGCGTGFVPAWMARRGAEVVGVDISTEQPATARRRLVEFNLDFADWLRVFRDSGFAVEDHPELSIPRSTEHRHGVTIEWARRFPADQVWQLRRT